MKRRDLLAGGALAAAEAACGLRKPRQTRKNILFIMADDHSAQYLSCYGSRVVKTPHLDRLANEGTRFENAYCTNSLCAPGRAAILTGTYSHINGIRGNSEAKDAAEYFTRDLATFPQVLQQAGYRTGIVGKWHLSDKPAGFNFSCVLPGQGVYTNPIFHENGAARQFEGHATDVTTNLALRFLEESPPDQPWCLLYQHKAPHRPFQPPERFARRFANVEIPYPETFEDDYSTRRVAREAADMRFDESLARDYPDLPAGLGRLEKKQWIYQRFARDYCAGIEAIDENLGRVLTWLDERNLTDETLIVYTSDNGFFVGDHGWYDKRFMYEPSMRIPLLIRWPTAPRGRVSDHLVANIDVAPTILDYAGASSPESIQGQSLRNIVNGGQQSGWRDEVYYTYYENSWALRNKTAAEMADPTFRYWTAHRVGPHRGIRTATHKLIHYYSDGDYYELFDLRKDPHELHNIFGVKEEARLVEDLRFRLEEARRFYRDT
ncbi:MAG: sulfatase [Bryobacterales bacterium]|nr:sulfatase [Bryobacterales bacterium]